MCHTEGGTPRHDMLDTCLHSGVAERGGRFRLGSGIDFLDGEVD